MRRTFSERCRRATSTVSRARIHLAGAQPETSVFSSEHLFFIIAPRYHDCRLSECAAETIVAAPPKLPRISTMRGRGEGEGHIVSGILFKRKSSRGSGVTAGRYPTDG